VAAQYYKFGKDFFSSLKLKEIISDSFFILHNNREKQPSCNQKKEKNNHLYSNN
jgi:hypothetical protein